MMDIGTIIKKCDLLKDSNVDKILFEGAYPVLFTITDGDREFLAICPVVNSKEMIWIVSETSFLNLIELLTNKITIRDAFLAVSDEKICLKFDGTHMETRKIKAQLFPEELLPDEGEFIDAEPDEFEEEIEYFQRREKYRSIAVRPIRWQIFTLQRTRHALMSNNWDRRNSVDYGDELGSFINILIPSESYNAVWR